MKKQKVFIPVDINDRDNPMPTKSNEIILFDNGEAIRMNVPDFPLAIATHWLNEQDGYFLPIDELNNVIRDAFNAGSKWGKSAVGEFYGGSENENKDCIDYIESLNIK